MRIRKDNDIKVLWAIERGSNPENMETATDVVLTMIQGYSTNCDIAETVIQPTSIADNVLTIEIPKEQNSVLGAMRLKLEYTVADPEMADGERKMTVDKLIAVIVESTELADTTGEFAVTSDAAIGFEGRSAFEVWLIENPDKTLQDYFDWLQQPATDAAALANDAATLANDAATLANEKAGLADTAATLANEKAGLADTAATLANEKAGLADAAATLANTKAALADEKAGLADAAATLANNAADLATTAASLNKGYFTSTAALNTYYPSPTDGQIAYVADVASSTGFYIYNAVGGAWVASTIEAPAVEAPLSEYTLNGGSTKTAAQLDSDIVQLAGEVSLLDAVQGAKIKDIENVLSTANLNQSAQLSVSGVSPLSLPKNAANSGMSVKLEGLTEDVGGVITHFEPTGRVRSVGKNGLNPTALYLTAPELRSNGTVKDEIRKGANGYELVKRVGVGINVIAGSEKINNGTFEGGLTGLMDNASGGAIATYSLNTSSPISGSMDGRLQVTTAGTSAGRPMLFFETTSFGGNAWRRFSFKYKVNSGVCVLTAIPFSADATNLVLTGSGTITIYFNDTRLNKYIYAYFNGTNVFDMQIDDVSVVDVSFDEGEIINKYMTLSDTGIYPLATPQIIPINYGGVLNSAENGTVYHEPIIADAGVYDTKMDILLQDYPIATIEEIIKHENGVDTYLNVATAVIAGDGLSFTHPDLASGDLVLFTYAFDKESTNGNITATFYDSNVVKIDTVTGKAYKITDVVTNGVLTRTLTEV